jgi:hypothetical protein
MNHNVIKALEPLLVEIDSLNLDQANAREGHDVEGIAASLREFGQRTPLVALSNGSGRVLKGNGTLKAARKLGWTHVAAILVEDDSTTATRYAIADNRLGDKSHFSLDALGKLLDSLDEPESVPGADEDWLEEVQALTEGADQEPFLSVAPDARPNPRNLPIDVIYTLQGADATCCLAVRAGLKYGIQSASYILCPYCVRGDDAHRVVFIDNDYFNYDHQKHIAAVRELRPKYATVMDVMTQEQCAKDEIEYAPLEQVLDWAAELEQYTENVIVIPKYNCLDQIPERYVLGYSVPTSHGGTPLPVSAFKGRRVHLLGGSWKAQLAHMAELGDDVVCLDNNYIQKIARQWAQFVTPDGETKNLTDEGYNWPTNPRYLALAFSFGAMGAKVNELFNSTKEKISNSLAVAATRLTKTRRVQCIALS